MRIPDNNDDSLTQRLDESLKRLGYRGFRPGQREAIITLLQERHLLLVAPTGGGKSLCYQLPALLLEGITLVVSPLIALMHDQVDALTKRGIKATFFASTLDADEMRYRLGQLRRGAYQVVYAAPERLVLDSFRNLIKEANTQLIAVDEAHCISEWGHDFRPEYLKIGELVAQMPKARVLACTATATPVVRDEIMAKLGLPPSTTQIVRGFARPNLALGVEDVSTAKDKQRAVDKLLKEALGGPGSRMGTAIIYAPTRKATEQEAERLSQLGYRAIAYHAGMSGPDRQRAQETFIAGKADVTVATNAFGMGIDRSDVRAVVHLAPPGSIEAYYQEVGRAGRDGEEARGLLLLGPSDMPLRRGLLTRVGPDGLQPDPAIVEHKWGLFLELMRWAEGGSCRHDAILRYFGDEQEVLQGCGRCDVCQLLEDGRIGHDSETVQLIVRKALSAVARIHGRFGLKAAVQMLRGVADDRLSRAGMNKVRTFGVLREHSELWLLALLRRCVTAGWVDFSGEERPVVLLTQSGAAVMRAQAPARLLLPELAKSRGAQTSTQRRPVHAGSRPAAASATELALSDPQAQRLFAALRQVRLTLSQQAKVPPYVVASDKTLRDLALLRPTNLEELKLTHGIGPAKAERFGHALLGAIHQASQAS